MLKLCMTARLLVQIIYYMWPGMLTSPEVTKQSIARWVENYQNMDFTSGPSAWRKILNKCLVISVWLIEMIRSMIARSVTFLSKRFIRGRGWWQKLWKLFWTISCKTQDSIVSQQRFVTANQLRGVLVAKAGMSLATVLSRQAVFHKG